MISDIRSSINLQGNDLPDLPICGCICYCWCPAEELVVSRIDERVFDLNDMRYIP